MAKKNQGNGTPSSTEDWCRGCGKKLHMDDPRIVEVSLGQLKELKSGKLSYKKGNEIWGHMHENCFLICVGDPEAIRRFVTPGLSMIS